MEGFVYYGNLDGVHFLVSLERENDEFLKSYQTNSPRPESLRKRDV